MLATTALASAPQAPRQQPKRHAALQRSAGASTAPRGHAAVRASSAAGQRHRPRNVVLAADASEYSLYAWSWVLENLWEEGHTRLTLLHVLPDLRNACPFSGALFYVPPAEPDAEQHMRQQAAEFLDQHFVVPARSLGAHVDVVLVQDSRRKHVGWAVCEKATELQAEPLVLAAHDKGFLEVCGELAFGSVSRHIQRHCKQPLLVLHPDHSSLA